MVDIIVVGAGHAGAEAALAGARMGCETILLTLHLDKMALMPCNPSVGGPAKGVVVREIEALGGMMGRIADKTGLQFKMLNTSKGPGVQCLRVQSDKTAYSQAMSEMLLRQEKLTVIQAAVDGLIVENNQIKGVFLEDGRILSAKTVILTTGTYMAAKTMISADVKKEGPQGLKTTSKLSESLKELGLELFRLKTGTPPRVARSSVDFSKTEVQPGDSVPVRFSRFSNEAELIKEQYPCYLTYTNAQTHAIIQANLDKSSMYSGVVEGVGARYCPSIEDKIVRFADKPRHQIFLEPETAEFDTVYVQGLSSSLPRDVQEAFVKTLPGLENAKILVYAYAIEYDAINPLQMKASLESKVIENLFTAGQINGTSGYEEAAGQGLLAGINAVRKIQQKAPIILRRDQAYLGVMIDDLVTKGTNEPYRLLTSRSEYRLLTRHDNSYRRLSQIGYEIGLLPPAEYESIQTMLEMVDDCIEKTRTIHLDAKSPVQTLLTAAGYDLSAGNSLFEVVKRPKISLFDVVSVLGWQYSEEVIAQAEIEIKYEGYIAKAEKDAEKLRAMEAMQIPTAFDYQQVPHLALEARQKLELVRPKTVGQASRISGVNPADIAMLAMSLKKYQTLYLSSKEN